MPRGPGKYDDLATYVREQSEAEVAIVIVIDGNKGSGFSMQAPPKWRHKLPTMLRMVAFEIETADKEDEVKLQKH